MRGRKADGFPELAMPCRWTDPDDETIRCTLLDGHRPMRPGWRGHAPSRIMLVSPSRRTTPDPAGMAAIDRAWSGLTR